LRSLPFGGSVFPRKPLRENAVPLFPRTPDRIFPPVHVPFSIFLTDVPGRFVCPPRIDPLSLFHPSLVVDCSPPCVASIRFFSTPRHVWGPNSPGIRKPCVFFLCRSLEISLFPRLLGFFKRASPGSNTVFFFP